jgi:LPS sulfotransferase NodH
MAQDLASLVAPESGRRRFVIYGSMRTGSNFLVSQLNQLPGVVCHGEVFNPNFVGLHPTYARNFRIPRRATAKRNRDPETLYERLLDVTPQITLVGFKIFPGHDCRILEKTLSDTQVRKIILRRDIVESFVSLCQAEQSKVWMMSSTDKEPPAIKRERASQPINFEERRFLHYRKTVDRFHEAIEHALSHASHQVLRLDYGDLQAQDFQDHLCNFLGAERPSKPAQVPLAKINNSPLYTRVTNPREMLQTLAKHKVPCSQAVSIG